MKTCKKTILCFFCLLALIISLQSITLAENDYPIYGRMKLLQKNKIIIGVVGSDIELIITKNTKYLNENGQPISSNEFKAGEFINLNFEFENTKKKVLKIQKADEATKMLIDPFGRW